ncbi:MAG: hypothetical protein AB8C02_06630 [Halioglobus sp.]
MYRYSADNAVTYTPDDLALFRESPFALWMERLTLENPDHGIPPDIHSSEPHPSAERQDEIVDTLRAEGRNVALIDWDQEESLRRAATLAAMEDGADFIVNGALEAVGFAGTANLMMRTSGYSTLGDFLYVPCDTQGQGAFVSAFRLCFLSDLLQQMQGQLPPQMLMIRGDADVMPLQTEDHIYFYRAVKKRFLTAMETFRKHRMPDPAESSHFGRWSECASEVLKQRALSEEAAELADEQAEQGNTEGGQSEQQAAEASQVGQEGGQTAGDSLSGAEDPDASLAKNDKLSNESESHPSEPLEDVARAEVDAMEAVAEAVAEPASELVGAELAEQRTVAVGGTAHSMSSAPTLAEQASSLQPDTFKADNGPGRTPNLARFPRAVPDRRKATKSGSPDGSAIDRDGEEFGKPSPRRRASDIALQNLEFIGSGPDMPFDPVDEPEEPCEGLQIAGAPPPNLRHLTPEEAAGGKPHHPERRGMAPLPDLEPPEPALLPPEAPLGEQPASRKPHPLDSSERTAATAMSKDHAGLNGAGSTGSSQVGDSIVDLDGAPPPELLPVEGDLADATLLAQSMRSSTLNPIAEPDHIGAFSEPREKLGDEPPWAPSRTFSDSLITSERIDDF